MRALPLVLLSACGLTFEPYGVNTDTDAGAPCGGGLVSASEASISFGSFYLGAQPVAAAFDPEAELSQGPAACVRPGGGEALWRFLIGAEYGGQVHVAADEGTYNVETLPGVQLSVEIDSPQFDQVYTFSAWTSGSLTVLGASPFRVSGGNLNASYGATPMFINFTADATE